VKCHDPLQTRLCNQWNPWVGWCFFHSPLTWCNQMTFSTHESRVFSPEVVLFVIVISSVSLAFETPYQDPNSEAPWATRWWDFFGTKFFQTEGSLNELRRWKKVFFWKIGSHAFVPGAVEKQSFHLSWREKMGSFPTWDLWSMCSHQTADYTRRRKI